MAWGLSKPQAGRFDKKVERLPRLWHRKHGTFFHALPASNLTMAERDKMFNRLRSEASLNSSAQTTVEIADRVEQATVETIRAVSASNQFVGPNCMSVLNRRLTLFTAIRQLPIQNLGSALRFHCAPVLVPEVWWLDR